MDTFAFVNRATARQWGFMARVAPAPAERYEVYAGPDEVEPLAFRVRRWYSADPIRRADRVRLQCRVTSVYGWADFLFIRRLDLRPDMFIDGGNLTMSERYTEEAYSRLQAAYDAMNAALFDGALPACLMTWQRQARTMGYFSPDRFDHRQGDGTTHEIALNPDHFTTDLEVMQTLVHEMVHLWQHVAGKPSRRTYHNAEWAGMMEAIGLMPSDTGAPGGKKTGQKMSDYPIPGGRFEEAVVAFLATGPVVEWKSRPFHALVSGGGSTAAEGEEIEEEAAVSPKKKVKYTCPECGMNVWGKPGLNVMCGEHQQTMEAQP